MKTQEYFKILCQEIHSCVVATVDEKGLPHTRVIDMMLYDREGLYFLTAKGKSFYKQITNKPYISLSAITQGENTLGKKSITISSAIKSIGSNKLDEIFKKNSYMADIYPTKKSRSALEVFCLYRGQGEFFELGSKQIIRKSFSFGGEKLQKSGYFITESCQECGLCKQNCPQDCIEVASPYKIVQEHCLHCGNCFNICPNDAIIKLS